MVEDKTGKQMEVFAYEMYYDKEAVENIGICCVPFEKKYFEEYMRIYNECFFDMRKALDIEPYDFLQNYGQISEKAKDIYLLLENEQIIGSVACYGNEIDDLFVNKRFQRKGYGRQLLLWGMQQIRKNNLAEIILHVAAWNEEACKLYQQMGFEIKKVIKVR